MPIHDLGYRKWSGHLVSGATRWQVIAGTGIRRVWQSAWIRRIVFFAWLPLLLFAGVFLIFEWGARGGPTQQIVVSALMEWGFAEEFQDVRSAEDVTKVLVSLRHECWLRLIQIYFRYPQGIALVLVVGLISPRLISDDVSSRAFLFYFSRPLNRFEYLLGKLSTVWVYLAAITTIPALCMYLMAVALSASPEVVLDTWDIPLRILVASVVVIGPAGVISLCFSSLTRDSRYAGFAWFALWTMGVVTWVFVSIWRANRDYWGDAPHRFEEYFSIHHVFGAVQRRVFGLESFTDVKWFIAILFFGTAAALMILFRRISAPMKA